MKNLQTVTDPVYTERTYSAADRFFLKLIRDKRDLPFIYLTIKITCTLIPLAVLMYLPGLNVWLFAGLAVAYHYFNNFTFKGPFGLMLHCTSHRAFFRKEYKWLNHYLPWIIAPFFGHSPGLYYAHHVGMHHPENNLEDDESTTMPFQRDSLRGFSMYLGKFMVRGTYDLAAYFFRRHRTKLYHATVQGELFFIMLCLALSFISFKATLIVFIIPYFLYRIIAFMGNWAQHAFVVAEDPGNPYLNSVTCVNTPYNHKCWNDGYHISHHIHPAMHWTEHPDYFRKTINDYAKNDAVVFDGIHFLHVFIYLMRKRYDLLAKHFVNVGNRYRTDEEVMAMLRSRTKKITFT
jgi:fatty acid desaturase